MNAHNIPVCLTIAGSDSGGAAGVQADLRAFGFFETFGTSVITAITAQNPLEVTAIHGVPVDDIAAQYRAVAKVFDLRAIKTGMLFEPSIINTVAAELERRPATAPLVVDPVMVATSGTRLLQDDAVDAMVGRFLPLATLMTPNLPEADIIHGDEVRSREQMITTAAALAARYDSGCLLKGGHNAGADAAVDILALADGIVYELATPVVAAKSTHGTGCTLSSAIAANLAHGRELLDAAVAAKAYVYHNLQACRAVGSDVYAMYPPAGNDESVVQVKEVF